MNGSEFKSLEGLHVLVVDDNPISRRLMSHILLQWKVSTDLASNGKIAVEMVSKVIYDVVLMDVMMPELDGYEATRAIRAMGGHYFLNLPIFAFSASPDLNQIRECTMNGLITKTPVNKEELYQTIAPYLK